VALADDVLLLFHAEMYQNPTEFKFIVETYKWVIF